ncbi:MULTISPECIES: biotin--[acetyl-CoA-carboxylase] ligase [Prochlorococcus]|uniref:biotin--[acetyl-CoA-carboxylase] ligase n=1 Tax=Prochlorococcus TaxID=1218 RepID=UPI000533833A|nr:MULTISPECIES: biotin--[acetyl-CoA-carboxylase] ligase [Prochlorococcus]KGG12963.1 Biotin-protein ligase [Prochlorococcus sp. MIT 0601]
MLKLIQQKGAGAVAYFLKIKSSKLQWHIRSKPVCGSTEIELSKWLNQKPLNKNYPRAFLAERQSYGRGQYGRTWNSLKGGVWVSVAIPLRENPQSTELFGLAISVALAKKLHQNCVPAKIKWPNDLLVQNRKLAGFLPRLIIRGSNLKFVRIGIGLNVLNQVPKSGISLRQILGRKNLSKELWTAEVLIVLEEVLSLLKDQEKLCKQASELLWSNQYKEKSTGCIWKIEGFNENGSLRLRRGSQSKSLSRWE